MRKQNKTISWRVGDASASVPAGKGGMKRARELHDMLRPTIIKHNRYKLAGIVITGLFSSVILRDIINYFITNKQPHKQDVKKDSFANVTPIEVDPRKDIDKIPNKQLIGKLLEMEDIVVIYGPAGIGKSVFAYQIANDIALGRPSMTAIDDTGEHQPQHVLYYDCEHNEDDLRRIFGQENRSWAGNTTLLMDGSFVDETAWLKDLDESLKNCDGDQTVFLDNITSICSTASADRIRMLINFELKSRQRKFKERGWRLTFIIIAHTTKDGQLAGSQNISNFGTNIIELAKYNDKKIVMTLKKNRQHGELINHSFVLERCETEEGRKYFKLLGEKTEDDSPASNPSFQQPQSETKMERDKRYRKLSANGMCVAEIIQFEKDHGRNPVSKQRIYQIIGKQPLSSAEDKPANPDDKPNEGFPPLLPVNRSIKTKKRSSNVPLLLFISDTNQLKKCTKTNKTRIFSACILIYEIEWCFDVSFFAFWTPEMNKREVRRHSFLYLCKEARQKSIMP